MCIIGQLLSKENLVKANEEGVFIFCGLILFYVGPHWGPSPTSCVERKPLDLWDRDCIIDYTIGYYWLTYLWYSHGLLGIHPSKTHILSVKTLSESNLKVPALCWGTMLLHIKKKKNRRNISPLTFLLWNLSDAALQRETCMREYKMRAP